MKRMPSRGGSLPIKSTKVPKLKAEREEADWHSSAEGRQQTQSVFTSALGAGKLVRSSGLKVNNDPKVLSKSLNRPSKALLAPFQFVSQLRILSERNGLRKGLELATRLCRVMPAAPSPKSSNRLGGFFNLFQHGAALASRYGMQSIPMGVV